MSPCRACVRACVCSARTVETQQQNWDELHHLLVHGSQKNLWITLSYPRGIVPFSRSDSGHACPDSSTSAPRVCLPSSLPRHSVRVLPAHSTCLLPHLPPRNPRRSAALRACHSVARLPARYRGCRVQCHVVVTCADASGFIAAECDTTEA